MNWRGLEAEITRMQIHLAALELIAFIVFFVVLYFVVKAAVRDGINEASRPSRKAQAIAKSAAAADLPDMRAER